MNRWLIQTERLGASLWKEEYTEEFIRMNADTEVMRYFLHPLSRQESLEFLERISAELSERGYGLFALSSLREGDFVGFVGLHHFDFEADFAPGVEVSWRILPEYWSRGYASEMATACLDYAKDTLHLGKVYAFTSLPNTASQRVMQKIGMVRVGKFDHPLVPEGHSLRSHILYRTDW